MVRPKRTSKAPKEARVVDRTELPMASETPRGCHIVQRVVGPLPEKGRLANGAIALSFRCECCSKRAGNTHRLLVMARLPCQPTRGVTFAQEQHELHNNGMECKRCGIQFKSRPTRLAKCPVRVGAYLGIPHVDLTEWYKKVWQYVQSIPIELRAVVGEANEAEPNGEDADAVDEPVEALQGLSFADRMRAYRSHRVIKVQAASFCIECGGMRRMRGTDAVWATEPCSGRIGVEAFEPSVKLLVRQCLFVEQSAHKRLTELRDALGIPPPSTPG